MRFNFVNEEDTTLQENYVIGRKLQELTLKEPFRCKAGDSVEKWLCDLLCLDATSAVVHIFIGIFIGITYHLNVLFLKIVTYIK